LRSYHRVATFSLWLFRARLVYVSGLFQTPAEVSSSLSASPTSRAQYRCERWRRLVSALRCRTAFCLTAGVIASYQTPHLKGGCFVSAAGFAPANACLHRLHAARLALLASLLPLE